MHDLAGGKRELYNSFHPGHHINPTQYEKILKRSVKIAKYSLFNTQKKISNKNIKALDEIIISYKDIPDITLYNKKKPIPAVYLFPPKHGLPFKIVYYKRIIMHSKPLDISLQDYLIELTYTEFAKFFKIKNP
jgi:hypothetical protein